jgi:hypothetical protein
MLLESACPIVFAGGEGTGTLIQFSHWSGKDGQRGEGEDDDEEKRRETEHGLGTH